MADATHPWLNTLGLILVIGAAAYAALVIFLFFFQSRLIYFPNVPTRSLVATPQAIGLDYESVEIVTEDGVRLHGWFVPASKPRGVLLFFHGNAGNISHRLDSLQIFHSLGLSTLIIDYRGYGASRGRPSERGTYRDAAAAWRYLTGRRAVPPARIVLFGRSLGGPIAAHLARAERPAGLIVESAFSSVPDIAAELYPFLPARWLAWLRYDTEAYVREVRAPVLIVHSREDEIIAFRHAERLFAAAPEPKRLLELRGGHNDGFLVSRDRYVAGLERFLQIALGP